MYHPKLKHYKKLRAFLIALFIVFIILTPICTDIVSNGSAFYSNLPAHVHVWVEEPLSAEGARILTLMALESINQTFGYRMNLKSVNTFQNDRIEYYEHANPTYIYELAHLRAKAIAECHITINITFLKGVGPEADIAGGTGHAAGLSDWADDINLYFNRTDDLFSLQLTEPLNHTINNIGTLLHEFGHSFGLKHDIRSIMWTAEEVDNPTNASNPVNITYRVEGFPTHFDVWNNMTPQEYYDKYLTPNITGRVWYNYSKARLENTGSDPGYSQGHYYVLHDTNYRNITLVYLSEHYYDIQGLIVHSCSAYCYTFDLGEFSHYWLPEELARC